MHDIFDCSTADSLRIKCQIFTHFHWNPPLIKKSLINKQLKWPIGQRVSYYLLVKPSVFGRLFESAAIRGLRNAAVCTAGQSDSHNRTLH